MNLQKASQNNRAPTKNDHMVRDKHVARWRIVGQDSSRRQETASKRTSCARLAPQGCDVRVLDLKKVAKFALELRKCTSRTGLVIQSRDFQSGAAEVDFAY